jgi:hypothetical protein
MGKKNFLLFLREKGKSGGVDKGNSPGLAAERTWASMSAFFGGAGNPKAEEGIFRKGKEGFPARQEKSVYCDGSNGGGERYRSPSGNGSCPQKRGLFGDNSVCSGREGSG